MIHFSCPKCGKKYAAPPKFAGKTVRCRSCRQKLELPRTAATGASTDSPPPAAPDGSRSGDTRRRDG